MTRPVRFGRAGPRLAPGGTFGATVAAADRRLIDARFTIEGASRTNGFVNALPMLHNRFFPSIERGASPSLDELVTMGGYDAEAGPVWGGRAEISVFDAPSEELAELRPLEMIAGYYRSVGVSWDGGTLLEDARTGVSQPARSSVRATTV